MFKVNGGGLVKIREQSAEEGGITSAHPIFDQPFLLGEQTACPPVIRLLGLILLLRTQQQCCNANKGHEHKCGIQHDVGVITGLGIAGNKGR